MQRPFASAFSGDSRPLLQESPPPLQKKKFFHREVQEFMAHFAPVEIR